MMISLCLVKIRLLFRQPFYPMQKRLRIFLPVDVDVCTVVLFLSTFSLLSPRIYSFSAFITTWNIISVLSDIPFRGRANPQRNWQCYFQTCSYVIIHWLLTLEFGPLSLKWEGNLQDSTPERGEIKVSWRNIIIVF